MELVEKIAGVDAKKSAELYSKGMYDVLEIGIDPISAATTFSDLSKAMLAKLSVFYEVKEKSAVDSFDSVIDILDMVLKEAADEQGE